jgi:hypothetical protein
MPRPSPLRWLDHPQKQSICWRVQIMQFSSSSCHFTPLGFRTLFSNSLPLRREPSFTSF